MPPLEAAKLFSRGAALDSLQRRFVGLFDVRETTVTVGVTMVNLVQAFAERTSLLFSNTGAADVWITPTRQPSTTRGVKLAAGGGAVSISELEDSLWPTLEWNAISAGAGNVVYILEAYRYKQLEVGAED